MEFMTFSLSEVVASGTTLFLVTKLFEWIKSRKKAKLDPSQSIRDIQQIHTIMEEVVKETSYDRMIVFKAEDSAGIIVPGKVMYITAIYEKIHQTDEHQIGSIIKKIQRWRSDGQYYGMVADILSKGFIELITEQMPICNLKDLYEADKVIFSTVYHLITTDDKSKIFYCSLVNRTSTNPHIEDKVLVNSAINRLVDIFSRHSKYL